MTTDGHPTGSWERERSTEVRTAHTPQFGVLPSFIIRTGSEVSDVPLEWDWHSHPVHELVWARSGTLTARVGDVIFTVPEGYGLWIPAETVHAGRFTAGVELHEAAFHPASTPPLFSDATVVKMPILLQSLLDHLAGNITAAEREHAEAVVFDVLKPAENKASLCFPEDARIDPITRALLVNPADSRSLEQWSRQLNISDRTIARAFRSSTGLSFTQWRQVLRIHRAVSLLSTGLEVQEASDCLGYANASTFIAAFRRVMGTSPGDFRSRLTA